nr:unnamed protein product [Haemonchus contortus]
MNKSLDDDDNDETTSGTVFKMSFYEQSTLDGVIFIGLCVMCAGILLMAIKLCYNYVRNFPCQLLCCIAGDSTDFVKFTSRNKNFTCLFKSRWLTDMKNILLTDRQPVERITTNGRNSQFTTAVCFL